MAQNEASHENNMNERKQWNCQQPTSSQCFVSISVIKPVLDVTEAAE